MTEQSRPVTLNSAVWTGLLTFTPLLARTALIFSAS